MTACFIAHVLLFSAMFDSRFLERKLNIWAYPKLLQLLNTIVLFLT